MKAVFGLSLLWSHYWVASLGTEIVYVSPAGSDTASGSQDAPFRTVSHAVAVVGANGTVFVNPGVYTAMPSFNDEGISVLAYPEKSKDSASTHVFSGLNKYPSNFISVNKNGTTIRGFGFRQSRTYASKYGAVYIATFGGASIENCDFSDNAVGVSVLKGTVALDNCRFSTATTGSGNGAGTAVSLSYVPLVRCCDANVLLSRVGVALLLCVLVFTQLMGFIILTRSYMDFGGGGTARATDCTFDGPGTAFDIRDGSTTLHVENSNFRDLRMVCFCPAERQRMLLCVCSLSLDRMWV